MEMPLKKKQRKTKFLKRESLCMVAELEKRSYSDVYQMCMEKIRARIHLQRYDSVADPGGGSFGSNEPPFLA